MPVFDFRFRVQASLAEVRAFHHDASALRRLTPPPMLVQLHKVEPLAEGSIATFTLWLGPFPIRWSAVHSGVTDHGFTDTQTSGPAANWVHTHTFHALSARETLVHEHIEFTHFPRWRGLLSRLLFVRPSLWMLFQYRRWITCRSLRRQSVEG